MKIKVALAKYLDWAILAALALFLIFAIYVSFVQEDPTLRTLKDDIDKYERTVKQAMNSDRVPPFPRRDYAAELRDRFEHMAVISTYRRNPFKPPEEIDAGFVQLRSKADAPQSKTRTVKGARLLEVLTSDKRLDVTIAYEPEDRNSTVTFTAGPDTETKEQPIVVKIRDDQETVYLYKVTIRRVPEPPKPNGPVNVVIVPIPPEDRKMLRVQPKVWISFEADNTGAGTPLIGFTTEAIIYRRPAESTDAELVQITKGKFVPAQRREAELMWQDAQPKQEQAPGGEAPPPVAPGGPIVPKAADEVTAKPVAEQRLTIARPTPGAYVFLDKSVEEGESYVYKIVTVSASEEGASSETANPYITASPINVPAIVDIAVISITPGRTQMKLSRRDPDLNVVLTETFTVLPGMPIGGKKKIKIDNGPPAKYKEVDFSTDCILVDTLTTYRVPNYGIKQDREGKMTYKVAAKPTARILYMTPRGFLRVKEKETDRAATAPGAGGAPGFGPGPGR